MNIPYKLASVLPRTWDRGLAVVPRLSLGVSLDNPKFGGDSLGGILDWCEEHSDRCLVFLGDYLYRLTYCVLVRDDLAEATAAATAAAEKMTRAISNRSAEKFEVALLSEIAGTADYRVALEAVLKARDDEAGFARCVDATAAAYVQRKGRASRLAVSTERALELSTRYILEELAFYLVLTERGWNHDAYPGPEMPVLASILRGEIAGPKPLRRRVFFELKVAKPL